MKRTKNKKIKKVSAPPSFPSFFYFSIFRFPDGRSPLELETIARLREGRQLSAGQSADPGERYSGRMAFIAFRN